MTDEPDVPACAEVSNPGCRAQHSSVERLWRAPRTVTFRVEPRVGSAWLADDRAGRRGSSVRGENRIVAREEAGGGGDTDDQG
jgi:hypothetical protein